MQALFVDLVNFDQRKEERVEAEMLIKDLLEQYIQYSFMRRYCAAIIELYNWISLWGFLLGAACGTVVYNKCPIGAWK